MSDGDDCGLLPVAVGPTPPTPAAEDPVVEVPDCEEDIVEELVAVELKKLVFVIGLLVLDVELELGMEFRYGMAKAALCMLGITTEECTAPELVAGWFTNDECGAVVVAFVDVIVPFVEVEFEVPLVKVPAIVAVSVSEVPDGDDVTAGGWGSRERRLVALGMILVTGSTTLVNPETISVGFWGCD